MEISIANSKEELGLAAAQRGADLIIKAIEKNGSATSLLPQGNLNLRC